MPRDLTNWSGLGLRGQYFKAFQEFLICNHRCKPLVRTTVIKTLHGNIVFYKTTPFHIHELTGCKAIIENTSLVCFPLGTFTMNETILQIIVI